MVYKLLAVRVALIAGFRRALPSVRSELETKCQLNFARGVACGRLRELAEVCAAQYRRWRCEIRSIRHIEEIRPKLNLEFVSNSEVFEYRGIKAPIVRAVKLITPFVTQCPRSLRDEFTGIEESADTWSAYIGIADLIWTICCVGTRVCIADISCIHNREWKPSRPYTGQVELPGLDDHGPGPICAFAKR